MPASHDVIVVGLGAMGSAAAYHLAKGGRSVLALDRFTPPHALGSSHGRTRIIREAYFEHPLYVPLVQRAYELWAELEDATGRDLMRITGGLMIGKPGGVLVNGARRSADQHRLPHELLTASEVRTRFPALRPDDDMIAVWEPRAGILFPEACIDAHLALARRYGAALHYGEPLIRWRDVGDGVRVVTAQGEYFAGQLLLTAGSWIRSLVPEMNLPFTVERQVMYWFAPRAAVSTFDPALCPVHLWETAGGAFFYGFPDLGDGVKVAQHHGGETTEPDQLRRQVSDGELTDMRGWMRHYLPDADGELLSAAACMYTNAPDEHFWISPHPHHARVLIASPCSGHGFKFAAVVGEMLAQRLDGRAPAFDLSLFGSR